MADICNVDGCTTPATHTDWKDEPICSECVASAVEFGEKAESFKLITESGGKLPDITDALDAEPGTRLGETGQDTPISDAAIEILEGDDEPDEPSDTVRISQIIKDATVILSGNTTPDPAALTVFEESLTETGLIAIKDQAAALPAIAKNQIDYDQVYEFSTRLKRASVTARKKSKVIVKDLKSQFNDARGKVEKDLGYVIGIIEPIITDTITSRDYMESWTEALKENKALKLAAEQEAERTRVRLEKHRLINEENERQRVEAERIENERVKLERDRYEFECEKSRLSVGDAWDDGAFHFAEWISQEQLDEMLDLGGELDEMLEPNPPVKPEPVLISNHGTIGAGQGALKSDYPELTETVNPSSAAGIMERTGVSIKVEPSENPFPRKTQEQPQPKVMVIGSGDERKAAIAAIKNQSHGVIIASEKETEEIIEQINQPFIYSTDPTEKELQLLELAHPVISEIKRSVKTVIDFIDAVSVQGFESKTATTATRALIADIAAAAAKFSEAVEIPAATEKDCPF